MTASWWPMNVQHNLQLESHTLTGGGKRGGGGATISEELYYNVEGSHASYVVTCTCICDIFLVYLLNKYMLLVCR